MNTELNRHENRLLSNSRNKIAIIFVKNLFRSFLHAQFFDDPPLLSINFVNQLTYHAHHSI